MDSKQKMKSKLNLLGYNDLAKEIDKVDWLVDISCDDIKDIIKEKDETHRKECLLDKVIEKVFKSCDRVEVLHLRLRIIMEEIDLTHAYIDVYFNHMAGFSLSNYEVYNNINRAFIKKRALNKKNELLIKYLDWIDFEVGYERGVRYLARKMYKSFIQEEDEDKKKYIASCLMGIRIMGVHGDMKKVLGSAGKEYQKIIENKDLSELHKVEEVLLGVDYGQKIKD